MSEITINNSARKQSIATSRNVIESLKKKTDARRTFSEKLADWITAKFGSMTFLAINVIFFAIWLILNTGILPGVKPFDPFPFGLLTTIVSLEAIILAIFVLVSENRAAKIADLREEVDLQVDIITESELTKVLVMLKLLLEKNGIDISNDPDLEKMLKPTDTEQIEQALEEQVVQQS
jgi:uncharacterized membrane protein